MIKRAKPAASTGTHIDTLIGAQARLKGELTFEGTVRIDGQFEGNIHSTQDGTLIVSESAQIQGEVDVPNLMLHGTIRGNVRAGKSIAIGPKGRLTGDLEYVRLSLAEGGSVNGRCTRIDETAARKEPAQKKATAEPVSRAKG